MSIETIKNSGISTLLPTNLVNTYNNLKPHFVTVDDKTTNHPFIFITDEPKLLKIHGVRQIQDRLFNLLSEVENDSFNTEFKKITPFDCNINTVYGLDKSGIFFGHVYPENISGIKYRPCKIMNIDNNKFYIACHDPVSKNGGNLRKSRKRRNAKHKKTQKARKKQTIQLRNKYKQLKKGHRTLKRKQ